MEEEPEKGGVGTSTEAHLLSSSSLETEKDRQHQQEKEKQEPSSVLPDFQLASPSLICPFLRTFLDRFSELFPLVNDAAFVETRPHGKRPKHLVEALWLKDVLEKCLKEIEVHGSFSFLSQVVSDHEVAAKRVPESIEHMKSLNAEMHSLRQQIQAEDLAHKEAVINWNKTLIQMKQGIKDLKAQNKLTAKYRARGKVRDQKVLIFFDNGAKGNFISPELAARLGVQHEEMGPQFDVEIAAHDWQVSMTPLIGKLGLQVQGYSGKEDFYIMPLSACDVLLGMPWYFANHVAADKCERKVRLESLRFRKKTPKLY